MKKIIYMILVFTCIISYTNPILAMPWNPEDDIDIHVLPDELENNNASENSVELPKIEAQSGFLMDMENGETLFSKEPDKKAYPASTTKVLTALIALENGDLSEIVKIGNEAYLCAKDSSLAGIDIGEEISLEDLLYGLMLPSGNDAAYSVAVHIGRRIKNNPDLTIQESLEVFLGEMNSRIKDLGAKNSNFVTPDGYHDDNHYTTAHDMAIITRQAMTHKEFRKIISTKIFTIDDWSSLHDPNAEEKEIRYWWNSNALIQPKGDFFYPNAIGGKTGYTSKSQHCLVSSASNESLDLIAVVLGATKHGKWTDSISLFDYAFDNYELYKPFSSGQQISMLNINNNPDNDWIKVFVDRTPTHIVPKDKINNIKQEIEWMPEIVQDNENGEVKLSISAPVSRSQKVGTLVLKLDDKVLDSIDLISSKTVEKIDPPKTNILKKPLNIKTPDDSSSKYNVRLWSQIGIGVVVLIFIILIIRIILGRKRRKKYMHYRKRY